MRTILHSDINNFYASIECLFHPELRDKPLAVTGCEKERHGIILSKNYPAKAYGIKTGDVIWEAKTKCPGLITITADFKKYLRFSDMIKKIYYDYTDKIEPFGIDEAWLDVSESKTLFGNGESIANDIRKRIFTELGITASVGVSFNKIFAKLGSDMKKPDATTIIDINNYKQKVWGLPVSDLLYIGRATAKKLYNKGIYTIGDLADIDIKTLKIWLGKWGETLWSFANGLDSSPVRKFDEGMEIKSIGNSLTCYRDLANNEEVKALIYVLSESVALRMKKQGFTANTIAVFVRDNELISFLCQGNLKYPSQLSSDIAEKAMELFIKNYNWQRSVRSLGVKASGFGKGVRQLSLLYEDNYDKLKQLELAVENIRERFGHDILQRGTVFTDKKLIFLNPEADNVIHPVGYSL